MTPAVPARASVPVLLLEDSPGDASLVRAMIAEGAPGEFEVEVVTRLEAAKHALGRRRYVCVLCDLGLPDAAGLDAVSELRAVDRSVPVVVLTGLADDAVAAEALSSAQDYLLKDEVQPRTLVRAIRYAIERGRAEQRLRERDRQLSEAQQVARVGSWEWDVTIDHLTLSEQLEQLLGFDAGSGPSALADFTARVHPDDGELFQTFLATLLATTEPGTLDFRFRDGHGAIRWLRTQAGGVNHRGAVRVSGILHDVTREREADEARRLVQRVTLDVGAAATMEDALAVVLNEVGRTTGWEYGEVWIPDEDGRCLRLSPARWCASAVIERFRAYSERVVTGRSDGLHGRAWTSGEPLWMVDLLGSEPFIRVDAARRAGLVHGIAIPIKAGDNPVGVMVFLCGPQHDDERRLLDVLMAIAVQVGSVIERRRAEDELRRSEDRYRRIVTTASEGIWVIDAIGTTTFVNDRMAQMLGYTAEDIVGRWFLEFMVPDERQAVGEVFRSPDAAKGSTIESRLVRRDGSEIWAAHSVSAMFGDDGRYLGSLSMVTDITERRAAEQALVALAVQDPLTGLPNRTLFLDRLGRAIARAERTPLTIAVLHVDLDRFKVVNDSRGHRNGDEVLSIVAGRLRDLVPETDTVARLGADEFAILCEGFLPGGDAVDLARRIVEAVRRPAALSIGDVYLSASVGVVLEEPHTSGRTADDVMRDAETATRRMKQRGRDGFEIFDGALRERARERQRSQGDLRRAVERNEFVLHYQPIVEVSTGAVTGTEALIRWKHPEDGLVSPDRFIPLAEESGLIVPIGEWALAEACRQAVLWQVSHPGLTMAVNLSGRQLQRPDFPDTVARIVAETGFDPSRLCLEITETYLFEDADGHAETLTALRALGADLAVDDFGTGYSSLLYLKRFPVSLLKIDRSFVAGLTTNADDRAIVTAVISLANALGLEVLAEGVEDSGQVAALRSLGCPYAQGYHFARPAPADAVTELLGATAGSLARGVDPISRGSVHA